MYKCYCLILFLYCTTLAEGQQQVRSTKSIAGPHVDPAIYTVLPYDSMAALIMGERFFRPKPTTLTSKEVDAIESLVDSSYTTFNRLNPNRQLISPLSSYRRQYVPVINGKGEKEVWIYFFAGFHEDLGWRYHLVFIQDGGVNVFQFSVNVTTRTASEIRPNGEA